MFLITRKINNSMAGNFVLSLLFVYLFNRVIVGNWTLFNGLLSFPVPFLASFSFYGGIILLMCVWLLILIFPGWCVARVSVLSSTMLDIVLTTNKQETIEFIGSLPIKYLVVTLGMLFLSLLAFHIRRRFFPFPCYEKYRLLIIGLATVFFFGGLFLNRNIFIEFYNNIVNYRSTRTLPAPSWHYAGPSNQHEYVNNVLIIGESSRADFWSLYGANVDTTPFINRIPKKYITNFIAPAICTNFSVPRLLAITDQKGFLHPENNIISLANEAGLKTYWFSTQGYIRNTSILSSQIADFAANKKFFKAYSDDFLLLPELKKTIVKKGRKFIVLHTLGSHVQVKRRVVGFKSKLKLNYASHANNYLKSVEKTDRFISEVYKILKSQRKSFSIIYVSDHGSNIIREGNDFKELRNDNIKQSYLVPFLQIDSDAKTNVKYDFFQSGYNLVFYLPYWLNLKTDLQLEKDIFSYELKASDIKIMNYKKEYQIYSNLKQGLNYSDIVSQ